jgi:Zn-dependent peptidase ImmA (M78 family)/transcriptional regulator with XRE-family HTH domain
MNKAVNHEMLVLARESRGLTQSELAAILRVTQGKVSKHESGLLAVSGEELRQIARALDYPEDFFSQTDSVRAAGSSCLYHRKRQTMPVRELRKIHAKINIARMQFARLLIGAEIESENKFHRMDVEDFEGGPDEIARILRENWGIGRGPIPHMVNAIEGAGGVVFRWPFGTRKLDAISQWHPGLPPIFFVNAEAPNDRMRYSLAHELGHVIMHRLPTPNQEAEADRFAAEFLMPADDIKPHLKPLSIQKAASLKPYWRVSMAALIKRGFDLGLVGASYYRKLFTQLSKLGYRLAEPAPLPDEEPTILADIIAVYLTEHKYSITELSRLVKLFEPEFRAQYLPQRTQFRLVD